MTCRYCLVSLVLLTGLAVGVGLAGAAAAWAAATAEKQGTEAAAPFEVVRFKENPLIRPELSPTIGTNINGPSLVRVPEWLEKPLGKYYLYFADHGGKFIRLAYADRLEGPWKIHEPGTLHLSETAAKGHIASPDVHVDDVKHELRMYFHGPAAGAQKSFLATSKDGLHFTAGREVLGPFYFRVFRHGDWWYAVAKQGVLLRSKDGVTPFEEGPPLFHLDDPKMEVRHSAVKVEGDRLLLFYSRAGDCPERILLSTVDMTGDWKSWKASPPQTVLVPEKDYEGGDRPLVPSKSGPAPGPVRQLRDPGLFIEDGRLYLLYSVAGESGIGMAELKAK
jgi:hypothetical protein